MKFLIVKLSSLGDVVCGLPAADALKCAFPECHITWIVDPRFAPVVSRCESVNEVVPFKPSFKLKQWPKFEEKFDSAIDLQGLLKSGLLVAKARSNRKYGYHWQREGSQLFSQAVLPDSSSLHIVDQYVDVARRVIEDFTGQEPERVEFRLSPRRVDVESVLQILPDVLPGRYVLLNPGAGWSSKQWPLKSFAFLANGIWELGYIPILIGGAVASEKQAEEELYSIAARESLHAPLSLIGKTTIGELIGLISECAVHVGGDTGTTHIAAALNRPAVGLYSITRPERSCPYRQFANTIYSSEGLDKISHEEVINRVQSLVTKRQMVTR